MGRGCVAPDPEVLAADRQAWCRSLVDALQPFALDAGTSINGMTDQDDERVRATYGKKNDRLVQIKATAGLAEHLWIEHQRAVRPFCN